MPMYLLNGEEKALKSVIKEQRIRIGRGLITITPVSEAGLVPEEDVKKIFESQQKVIDELSAKNESLVKENEELKAKGYRTICGKVPTKYFEEKFYGLTVAM